MWRTTDAGHTWENLSDGFFGGSIGAVAVSTSDPNILWVGEGEETVRGNVSSGFGLWKSVDAGRTWQHMGLRESRHISRIRIHPTNPDIVYVAVMGNLFADSEERGVYKTTDGGQSWQKILYADASSGAIDLTFDPVNPRILYASTWTFRRTPYSFSSGGSGSKLWKSTDEGVTWQEISGNAGFPTGMLGIIGVTVSPTMPERVWAMVENEPNGGLYRSDNGGNSWTKVNSDRSLRQRAWYYTRLYADTKDANKVYVLNVSYHVSGDGGKTFTQHNAPHGDHHDLWIDPQEPDRMIIADDGGAQITFDGGKNWSTYYNQPTAQFYRVSVDDHFPFRIYGAQQDNSSIRMLHRSDGGFITDRDWQPTAGGEAGHHAFYPSDNDIVIGGEYGGFMMRINHATNERQAINVWPNNPLGHGVEDMKYRFQWNYPLFFSRHNPDKLFAFSNHLHVSYDMGHSWQLLSPDLTTNDTTKQGPSGGPITKDNTAVEYYCTIFAAAESPLDSLVLWTGSDDGLIHVSQDGGSTWKNCTPTLLPAFTQINSMEPDPFHKGGLYVAATRYKWGDMAPYLLYTPDYGRTWQRIDKGIPAHHFTRVVRTDPNHQGLLFAGTEYGLHFSTDNGKGWQPFQQSLPVTPITDLAVKDRHLIVATQGRGFWILDDLSPLYEMDKNFSEKAYLYAPKPTYIMQAGHGGPSKTMGENHPAGAIVHYYLETVDTAQHRYTLRFLSQEGEVLRTFSSHKPTAGNSWMPKAGAGRFVWDLRTYGVDTISNMIVWFSMQQGPQVLPGTYTIEMIVDQDTMRQPLSLIQDPRTSATAEDLQARYDFQMDIRNTLNEVNQTIREIRSTRKQLERLSPAVTDSALQAQVTAAIAFGWTVEKALYQTQNRSPQDPLNYPIRLNNKFGHVGALAGIGYFAPTESMIAVKEELEAAIAAELLRWQVQKAELDVLNQSLRDAAVPYLRW